MHGVTYSMNDLQTRRNGSKECICVHMAWDPDGLRGHTVYLEADQEPSGASEGVDLGTAGRGSRSSTGGCLVEVLA